MPTQRQINRTKANRAQMEAESDARMAARASKPRVKTAADRAVDAQIRGMDAPQSPQKRTAAPTPQTNKKNFKSMLEGNLRRKDKMGGMAQGKIRPWMSG